MNRGELQYKIVMHFGRITHPLVKCFVSQARHWGGHEPTIIHNAPSWSYNLLLGQSYTRNGVHERTLMN